MDPLSFTASVTGILQTVTSISNAISRFTEDYKLADEELNVARSHAILLKEEIGALELRKTSTYSPLGKTAKGRHDGDKADQAVQLNMDGASFAKAMSTAHSLLSDIQCSFPLRSEPHTWKTKVRWALKDKQVLARLKERLKSAESTLQGILATEQLRISRSIYDILLQQQSTVNRIEKDGFPGTNVIDMAVVSQTKLIPMPAVIPAQFSENKRAEKQPTQLIAKATKLVPWSARFDLWGFSEQPVLLVKGEGTSYQVTAHVTLFDKMYSIQLRMTCPSFSFDRTMHVRNIVATDSEMSVACSAGDFGRVRKLLESGSSRGSDITASGWPMLYHAIESGSASLVSLLIEHGADPNAAYGEHNMTALQYCFLRGELKIARILLARGADLEHVDSDGYSVLSYLWIVDKWFKQSVDFMRLCLAHDFSEVNACDSRGWTAFHRAAAVGSPDDIEAFLRLGASLDLRAEWYGWTALFFAASSDNVETFQVIVHHSRADVYESLDCDGWNLLHCCAYFGSPRVMRLVLQNGVDVNQKTLPAPLPEDPELSYRELTASDIAFYVGPNRYQMFMDALTETGRDADLEDHYDAFWDAVDAKGQSPDTPCEESEGTVEPGPIYGAEDVDDRWTLLHWASYNGSPKVKELLLLKGADPEHLDAIALEENPTILPKSPFEGR